MLSVTFRNGEALAFRQGLRGHWREALAAFDARTYINDLGATATAQTLDDVSRWCQESGLNIQAWYGVRVLTDGIGPSEAVDPTHLQDLLAAELLAGARDPYRRLGSQIHVVARRGG